MSDPLSDLLSAAQVYVTRAAGNLQSTFSRPGWIGYLRLVIAVCTYCLIRPYIIKLGGRFQAKDHERELEMLSPEEEAKLQLKVKQLQLGPNEAAMLRQRVIEQLQNEEDGEVREDGSGTQWGLAAKKRAAEAQEKAMQTQEKRELEDDEAEDMKDIQQFLVD
jgi:Protein trafficking PGA2